MNLALSCSLWTLWCGCDECVTSRQEDSLRHSRSRINAYRALASPSLIALSSKDLVWNKLIILEKIKMYFYGCIIHKPVPIADLSS
ncbi:Uncharacterized protein GBIM_00055 [Gryllus bimaculatus]|nr:Uncharacterized protein GBIM_00055 [Gryllus bimaculatus]